MHDWIPLFQSLVWPAFISLGLMFYRKDVRNVLDTTRERLGRGGSFKLGPGGIELGEIQSAKALAAPDTRQVDGLPHRLYITHFAARAPELDRGELHYYRLSIAIDAETPEELGEVERVVYHLDPTFRSPDRESSDPSNAFEIRTAGWGEFNMTAEVFRRGRPEPLVVERYINFLALGG